jgi:hypothetical protein
VRLIVPLLVDDGRQKSTMEVVRKTIALTLGAANVSVEDTPYPSRNGWYRLGVAEFPAGGTTAMWVIEPKAAGN